MAMTATVAGPVMNILLGQGLSLLIGIISFSEGETRPDLLDRKWEFSIIHQDGPEKGELNRQGIIPLILISATMVVVLNILMNTLVTKFRPGYKINRLSVVWYILILGFLIFYSIYFNVQ